MMSLLTAEVLLTCHPEPQALEFKVRTLRILS